MALINCPECGKEISDMARNCPKCGRPMTNKIIIQNLNKKSKVQKKTIRSASNMISLSLSLVIMIAIYSSEGGVNGNGELCIATLFLIIPAIIGICGRESKVATIVSASFYFFGAFVSFIEGFAHTPCLILLIVEIICGTLLMVDALKEEKSL